MKYAIAAVLLVVGMGCKDRPSSPESTDLQELHRIEEQQRGGQEFGAEVEREVRDELQARGEMRSAMEAQAEAEVVINDSDLE